MPSSKTCVWPHIMAQSAGAKRQREALRREAAAYGVAYLALQWVIPLLNEDLWCQHTAKPARFARLFKPARFAGALRALLHQPLARFARRLASSRAPALCP